MRWYLAMYICGDGRYIEFGSLDRQSVERYLKDHPGGYLYESYFTEVRVI